MKSFLSKILSFLLAVLILFTTTSFTVDMHFCCNKLVDMSIIGKAETCKGKVQKKVPSTKQCTTLQEKDCCSNETIFKKGDDTFKKLNTAPEIETLVFLGTVFYNTHVNIFNVLENSVTPFQTYKPPLLSVDIQILNETFLI